MRYGDFLKAQITAEFMVILSVLLVIFLVFYVIFFGQTINLYHSQDSFRAMRDAYALSAAINYAHLAGDGLRYSYTLSGGASALNITVSDVAVESKRKHALAQAPIINARVNTTEITSSRIMLVNDDGVMGIEQ